MEPRPSRQPSRRQVLLGGLGAASALALGPATARAQSAEGTGPFGGSSAGSADKVLRGLEPGLVVTDLEVVTITDTSVTFSWATYPVPHPFYGVQSPTIPSDSMVLLGPAGTPFPLPVVHRDDTGRGLHLVTIDGLAPGTTYDFQCFSGLDFGTWSAAKPSAAASRNFESSRTIDLAGTSRAPKRVRMRRKAASARGFFIGL